MSRSFTHLAIVAASTRRPPDMVDGKRGAPAPYLASVACTPIDPVDEATRQMVQTEAPYRLRQTFVDGDVDVRKGDVLVVGTAEYYVSAAENWHWPGSNEPSLRLVLEEIDGAA